MNKPPGRPKAGRRPVFFRQIQHAGRTGHVMITVNACSKCSRANTLCAVVIRDTNKTISFNGEPPRPLFRAVSTLCAACFEEYWRDGGCEGELA